MRQEFKKVTYENLENDMIRFTLGEYTFTCNPDDMMHVTADNDGSAIFDPKAIVDMDEDFIYFD